MNRSNSSNSNICSSRCSSSNLSYLLTHISMPPGKNTMVSLLQQTLWCPAEPQPTLRYLWHELVTGLIQRVIWFLCMASLLPFLHLFPSYVVHYLPSLSLSSILLCLIFFLDYRFFFFLPYFQISLPRLCTAHFTVSLFSVPSPISSFAYFPFLFPIDFLSISSYDIIYIHSFHSIPSLFSPLITPLFFLFFLYILYTGTHFRHSPLFCIGFCYFLILIQVHLLRCARIRTFLHWFHVYGQSVFHR